MKIQSNFNLDFIENPSTIHPKIHPKSIENPWKSGAREGPEGFGRILARPGGGPGGVSFWSPSWEPFGRALWSEIGASLRRPGVSWGILMANMAPTWLAKGSKNRVKIEAKSDQNFYASYDSILCGFLWILKAKWTFVGFQNRTKIDVILKTLESAKTL